MATSKKPAVASFSGNLNQFTREAAEREGAVFLACWDEYHAAHPERFTPEAIRYR